MRNAIADMCNAVLNCDGASDANKAWARDLLVRVSGQYDWLRGFA